jgi:hypothetical protein
MDFVKTKGKVVPVHARKVYALDGRERSTSRPGRITAGKEADTHRTGGWVGFRAGLDDLEM